MRKGTKHTKKTLELMRKNQIGMKGKKHSETSKEKMRKTLKEGYANGRKGWNKGFTKETDKRLKKISDNMQGHENFNRELKGCYKKGHIPTDGFNKNPPKMEKNWNWRGGKSFETYGPDFNKKLKEKIRKNYEYRCQECFRHQDELRTKTNRRYKLVIHHIDFNKKNNKENNLIPLCMSCHGRTQFNREQWIEHYSNKVGGK